MRRCALTLSLLALAGALSAADPLLPGAQFFHLGAGARSLALGGAGAALSGEPQSLFYNPAALALNEQTRLSLDWGPCTGHETCAGLGLSLPFSRGVLAWHALLADLPGSPGAGQVLMLRGAFAKQITPHFLFGFGLTLPGARTLPSDTTRVGVGLDLGFQLLETGTETEIRESRAERGFGFRDFVFGFSLQHLGPGLAEPGYRTFPDTGARAGLAFRFFKSPLVDIQCSGDLVVPFNDFKLGGRLGADATFFGFLHARAGLALGNDGQGPVTLGLSLAPPAIAGDSGFELAYAWVPFDFRGRPQHGHFLSLNLALGDLDREGPAVRFATAATHFSPNNDGVQDTVAFDVKIEDNRELKGWTLEIRDATNGLVRVLSSHGEKTDSLSLDLFVKRLFARKSSVDVPAAWTWNGADERGKTVPDGTYTYRAAAFDARKNRGHSAPGTLVVKTAPPLVEDLRIDLTIFSPGRAGSRDHAVIRQKLTTKDTEWRGELRDGNGKVVRRFSWKQDPPAELKWDGKDDDGRLVPDGDYEYHLEGQDKAGNRARKKSTVVTVSTKRRAVAVAVDKEGFSPNGDGFLDAVSIVPTIQDKLMLEGWTLEVRDAAGKVLRTWRGAELPPGSIAWDGKDDGGRTVPDGTCSVVLSAAYKDGDKPASSPRSVLVDTTPPRLALVADPRLFSPDGDGELDQLTFKVRVDDAAPIARWKLVVWQGTEAFKTFTGDTPRTADIQIVWDGKGDNGDTVESASQYHAGIEATDAYGNTGRGNRAELEVDVLVVKTSRGLKIRVSNIEFAFDKWDLKHPDSPVLNRVSELLKKYAEYKVIIEGHTDGVGDLEYNLMLSTRRARTVLKYLVRKGIDEDRLLDKGLGMSVPITSNATVAGQAKNRRVEFILVKDE